MIRYGAHPAWSHCLERPQAASGWCTVTLNLCALNNWALAIVESPAEPSTGQRRYIVALMSDVLRKNSAVEHARIAAAIEELIATRHATASSRPGEEPSDDP